ncbi:MAG: hypothetical protein U5Q44_04690 [Dehalococcoidia bacterium]|nr:hypothetical protein [Dehalococcoidia bacterium]
MSQADVDGLFEDLSEQLTAIHTVESGPLFAALDASVPAAAA